ncbi:putative uncharacterized protein DDB_G0271606 isoform X2 [Condylostylus longicornis]|uniref:putative uncharacterized protein DDB_G0271606 isoform X2 n=1 Tax=Condylostylus longicornis TaxID=2530218 RepID=UPI00244DD803|nr:putative uncharacterized protein DDB_G0271606 isoform X2 [Condylostylus longicornis]
MPRPSFIGAAITPATFQYTTQNRIMNPIVPVVTCQQSTLTRKIRRKTDSKPQSQINKCNNEKRRRELENNYIEQLGEFLQLNKRGDMTTSKPDKAAILNQVVKTYRDICDKRNTRDNLTNTTCSNTDNSTFHPVQQEKISSTESLHSDQQKFVNPEISAYFETLEHYVTSVGWILLQINPEGIIESCTHNIKELIGYHKTDLIRQPIYSYLHPGDHAKLSPILNNMLFNLSGWDQDESQQSNIATQQKSKRSITTKVRMLVKHNEESSETIEEKQQRQENYEEVVFIAAPIKDDGDDSSSVLCLITRPEDDSPLETNMQQHIQQRQLEQMTLKLDIHGKIMEIDTSALRPNFSSFFSKERGTSLLDLCHIEDLPQVQTHLNKLTQSSTLVNQLQNHNASFRLRLGSPDVYVHVKASSRLFVNCTPGESDYIMSVQTVVNNDNDMQNKSSAVSITSSESMQQSTSFGGIGGLDVSNFSTSSNNNINNNNCNTNIMNVVSGGISSFPSTSQYLTSIASVGGPLMTSVINSEKSLPQVQTSSGTSNMVSSFSSPPSATEGTNFFPAESFEFDYMHSPFQLDVPTLDYRPASRTSVNTPVSTPRPPSGPTFSPVGNECPSPLTPHHISKMVSQPSPQHNANNNLHSNNLNSVFPNFPFQNFDDKDSKEHLSNNIINKNNENNNNDNNNNNNNISKSNNDDTNLVDINSKSNDSERLRNLLTKRTHSSALHDEQDHKNRILKGLLNAEEEKDSIPYNKSNVPLNSPKTFGGPRGRSSETNKNQMLLQLLNDKSEDDNPNRSRQSELLKQLQKDDTPKDHTSNNNPHHMAEEDLKSLLRIQDVPRKRPLNEPDDGRTSKRPDDKKQPSSLLREKNKMLASLLSNPAKAPTVSTITPVVKIIPDITSSSVNRDTNTLGIGTPGNIAHQQQSNFNSKSQNISLNQNNSQENQHLDQNKNQMQILSKQNLGQQQEKFGLQTSNAASDLQKQQIFPISTSTTSLPIVSPSSSTTGSVSQQMTPSSNITSSTPTSNTEVDPELSEILNDVIDIVPEPFMEQSSVSTTPTPSNQDINEKMAINIIQRSLMQMDQQFNNPPAYSQLQQINQQNNQQRFQQPPPMYQSRSVRMSAPSSTPSLMQQRYENSRIAQLHEKERLLQQQMKQHVVMSENASVRSELALNPNISLLNAVAPNVSLTRGIPNPDTHPSTNYTQGLMNQQLSPGQRNMQFNMPNPAAYQPQYTPNQTQRLSPQQHPQKVQQVLHQQQQQQAFQSGNTQLSPRLPAYSTQPNMQNNSLLSPIQASALQGNQRWTAGYNPRQFLNQRRNSTIDNVARQNSLPSQDTSNFPGPSSPNTTNFSPSGSVFNAQLQRIQRQTSAPQPNQHLGPASRSTFGGGPDNTGGAYTYGGYTGGGQQQTVQPNSEYVRQELRAVVSIRTQQQAGNINIPIDNGTVKSIQNSQSPIDIGQQNSMICANSTNPISPISTMQQQQQQQQHQQLPQQQIQRSNTPHQQPSLNTPTDTTLNFNFDLPAADFFGGPSAR